MVGVAGRGSDRALTLEDGIVDVADMTGKTVIITGANSGIGLETAVGLARAGAKTVITARDRGRGEAALNDIRARTGHDDVELVLFDLGSLASVREGAADILARYPRIDVLVNNAGVVLSDRRETEDGFEATFAVNHLGPFLLTELLLDRIKQSAPARIVNVASTAHQGARKGLDFDDLQSTRAYGGMQVYSKSKLANIYFTTELARRLEGSGVTVNSLHPGTVATGYGRDGDSSGLLAFGLKVIKPFILSAAQGARTSIYLASSPDVEGVTGQYFVKNKARKPSSVAQDDEAARRLWKISEELVAPRT
jgi:NAD(P)-dependent dehydrogenase (short-subunit alcohol dehydrogenase family)